MSGKVLKTKGAYPLLDFYELKNKKPSSKNKRKNRGKSRSKDSLRNKKNKIDQSESFERGFWWWVEFAWNALEGVAVGAKDEISSMARGIVGQFKGAMGAASSLKGKFNSIGRRFSDIIKFIKKTPKYFKSIIKDSKFISELKKNMLMLVKKFRDFLSISLSDMKNFVSKTSWREIIDKLLGIGKAALKPLFSSNASKAGRFFGKGVGSSIVSAITTFFTGGAGMALKALTVVKKSKSILNFIKIFKRMFNFRKKFYGAGTKLKEIGGIFKHIYQKIKQKFKRISIKMRNNKSNNIKNKDRKDGSKRKKKVFLSLTWYKPPLYKYKSLYIGARTDKVVKQSELKNMYKKNNAHVGNNNESVKVKKYLPTMIAELPKVDNESYKIGVSMVNWPHIGKLIGPYYPPLEKNSGGGKLNKILKKFGFRPKNEKKDADHIIELQIGGRDHIRNLWPLSSQRNREGGARLKNHKFRPNKKMGIYTSFTLSDLKSRGLYKRFRIFFIIKKFKSSY